MHCHGGIPRCSGGFWASIAPGACPGIAPRSNVLPITIRWKRGKVATKFLDGSWIRASCLTSSRLQRPLEGGHPRAISVPSGDVPWSWMRSSPRSHSATKSGTEFIPLLANDIRSLKSLPEVLGLDGHGIVHPRGIGLVSHFGLWPGIRTIGCASVLVELQFDEQPSHDPFTSVSINSSGIRFRSIC